MTAIVAPLTMIGGGFLIVDGFGPALLSDGAAGLSRIAGWQWSLAACAMLVSVYASGRIELSAHRLLETDVPQAEAMRSGRFALAISQAIGLAALTSAAVRCRMLPGVSMAGVAKLTGLVSFSYLFAVLALAGVAALAALGGAFAALAICAVLVGTAAPWVRPTALLPGLSKRRVAAMALWLLIDIGAAAAVLAALLPAAAIGELATYLAAYGSATAAGFLGQSPGGLGAFDAAILAGLPGLAPAAVISAALGYRLVYVVAPALVMLPALILRSNAGTLRHPKQASIQSATARARRRAVARVGSGIWGLVHDGAEVLLSADHETGWLGRRVGGSLIALGPALGSADPAILANAARRHGLAPLLYSTGAREASAARNLRWWVLTTNREAFINLQGWNLDGKSKSRLRRKLRKAESAGVAVSIDPIVLPDADMMAISDRWSAEAGGERGFSMGRYSPAYVRRQRVCLAYANGTLVGFVTFLWNGRDWYLDLVRHDREAPDGTVYALIVAAINEARLEGARTFSLACALQPALLRRWPQSLSRAARCRAVGLIQFKEAFAPRWVPRYVAAPGWLSLMVGLFDASRAVRMPCSPPVCSKDFAARLSQPEFHVETGRPKCDPLDEMFSRADAMIRARRNPLGDLFHDRRPVQNARGAGLDTR